MKQLYIIRGLPGSGKSTLASTLSPVVYEADQYFMVDGEYQFQPTLIKQAHAWCQAQVVNAMQQDSPVIAVSNTSTQKWEYQPYIDFAQQFGYSVFIIVCQNDFGNIHGVPPEAIERMRSRWEA